MVRRLVVLWVLGLVTLVPCGIYYLLFEASRDEYAALITFVLFWVFGFWGVAAPLVSALKVRRLMNAMEAAHSGRELRALIRSNESRDAVIDLIATENRIPRFLANCIYDTLLQRLTAPGRSAGAD